MKQAFKNVFSLLLALLVVGACEKAASDKAKVGEGKGATPAATTEANNPVVIEVNGKKIHQTEFEAAIESLPENMRNNFENPRARKINKALKKPGRFFEKVQALSSCRYPGSYIEGR